MEWVYTDTDGFGGSVNCCWQHKGRLIVYPDQKVSDLALIRRAKEAAGLTNVRCKRVDYGDQVFLYPYRTCTVLIIDFNNINE